MFDTEFLDIPALRGVHGAVRLPGSKSISNRVLLLAALCEGQTTVHDLLDSDDTRVMLDALRALGCGVQVDGTRAVIDGLGGRARQPAADLFLGNAGTAMRPLTAALAVLGGDYQLRGMDKPIGVSSFELTRALPETLQTSLPSIEAIERELGDLPEEPAE